MSSQARPTPSMLDAAKFTPPSLAGVVARPALEQALDGMAAPACWLCAPSGAGKSTLVAASAARETVPVLWYRLDERDNDPTFFFAQWRALAQRVWAPQATLSEFSYDEAAAPGAHAQRLLQELAAHGPALLVFDDEQLIGAAVMREVLAALGAAGRDGVRSIFCSQQPPAQAFYGAITRRALAVCWNLELALNEDDCAALAAQYRLNAEQAHELHAVCGGHAAAAVLACELLRATRSAKGSLQAVAGSVHGFLLERLVGRLPERLRELLPATAWLPQLRLPLVQRLQPGATAEDLELLADQGLLTRHLASGDVAYTAHDLVRAGARRLAGAEAGQRCAAALLDAGQPEDAFEIEGQLERWPQAADALLAAAPALVRAQRITHLLRAAERLPAAEQTARPELLLWCGQAALGLDPSIARGWLERAFMQYQQRGDAVGAATAAACVLIGYNTDMQEIHDLQKWLRRFEKLDLALTDDIESPWVPLLLLGRVCQSNIGSTPPEPCRLEHAFGSLMRLVRRKSAWPSDDQRANAARLLFEHCIVYRGEQHARQFASEYREVGCAPGVSAALAARWWLREARLAFMAAQPEPAEHCLERAAKLVAATAGSKTRVELELQRLEGLGMQNFAAAVAMLPQLERLVSGSDADCARLGLQAAGLLRRAGQFEAAAQRARAALDSALSVGYTGANARMHLIVLAGCLCAVGRAAEAEQLMSELEPMLEGAPRQHVRAYGALSAFLARGSEQSLRECFAIVRSTRLRAVFPGVPGVAQACAAALALGIETETVRNLIVSQKLAPPADAGAEWPWPIKVRCLGAFSLEIDGLPWRPGHKAQEKPLELLKLLCAAAASEGVADRAWLIDRLWPDAELADARKSLDMTVSRLRKLLDCESAVETVDSRLRLAPLCVWTDVGALRSTLHQLQGLRDEAMRERQGQARAPGGAANRVFARAVETYRGEFLAGEEGAWKQGVRAQLARQFRSLLLLAAASMQTTDEHTILCLEQALTVDPLAEELAALLMRAYLDRGQAAKALRAARDLSSAFAIRLNSALPESILALQAAALKAAATAGAPVTEAEPAATRILY
jgi:LuxR family transcriptional regulator, maltose regulon positive regulatory protein